MAPPSTDYDSPWKEALEHYLPDFMRMFLPDLYTQIDWSHSPIFLDKELQAITHDAASRRRIADKLVLVRLRRRGQSDCLLLIHIEVQGGRITAAAFMQMGERMYRYFYRISDRLLQAHIGRIEVGVTHRLVNRGRKEVTEHVDVVGEIADSTEQNNAADAELFSLCILTASTGGAPALSYQQGVGDYGVRFTCPVVHLAEWLGNWDELEQLAKTNPFAVIVMAQLMAQQTRGDGDRRFASKKRIVQLLYQYEYSRSDILQLMRLVDWMMQLPAAFEPLFRETIERIEQENKMTFVTSYERLARQEGESSQLLRQLMRKFDTLPDDIQQRVQTATSAQLETWSLNFVDADTLDEVFAE